MLYPISKDVEYVLNDCCGGRWTIDEISYLSEILDESVFIIILSVSSRFVTIRFFRNNCPSI